MQCPPLAKVVIKQRAYGRDKTLATNAKEKIPQVRNVGKLWSIFRVSVFCEVCIYLLHTSLNEPCPYIIQSLCHRLRVILNPLTSSISLVSAAGCESFS